MLHVRTSHDAVPSMGAASGRALLAVRHASDAAPAVDMVPVILVLERLSMLLFDLFCDIERLLLAESDIGARGPPVDVR